MPWTHCDATISDDVACPSCGITKQEWTIKVGTTRVLRLGAKKPCKIVLYQVDGTSYAAGASYRIDLPDGTTVEGALKAHPSATCSLQAWLDEKALRKDAERLRDEAVRERDRLAAVGAAIQDCSDALVGENWRAMAERLARERDRLLAQPNASEREAAIEAALDEMIDATRVWNEQSMQGKNCNAARDRHGLGAS